MFFKTFVLWRALTKALKTVPSSASYLSLDVSSLKIEKIQLPKKLITVKRKEKKDIIVKESITNKQTRRPFDNYSSKNDNVFVYTKNYF